ncbi:MAG: VOC family protein [Flavobacteriales bacterium]|nr:VOC family protein [Flavobacteriales bacterium]HQW32826.1 VOC family protein [Flavobacteriales bacterium]HQY03414.1 VOC family protein [Flavobacteriales bacterium]
MKKFTALKDYVTWFEIPAYDMERAKAFYDHVYHIRMETSRTGDFAMAYFPADQGIGGAVVQGPGCLPNDTGALIYLNAGSNLEMLLGRVAEAGGRVIMGRTLISEDSGWFALFIDTEGNRLALHERPAAKSAVPKAKRAAKRPTTRKPAAKKAAAKKVAKKK